MSLFSLFLPLPQPVRLLGELAGSMPAPASAPPSPPLRPRPWTPMKEPPRQPQLPPRLHPSSSKSCVYHALLICQKSSAVMSMAVFPEKLKFQPHYNISGTSWVCRQLVWGPALLVNYEILVLKVSRSLERRPSTRPAPGRCCSWWSRWRRWSRCGDSCRWRRGRGSRWGRLVERGSGTHRRPWCWPWRRAPWRWWSGWRIGVLGRPESVAFMAGEDEELKQRTVSSWCEVEEQPQVL